MSRLINLLILVVLLTEQIGFLLLITSPHVVESSIVPSEEVHLLREKRGAGLKTALYAAFGRFQGIGEMEDRKDHEWDVMRYAETNSCQKAVRVGSTVAGCAGGAAAGAAIGSVVPIFGTFAGFVAGAITGCGASAAMSQEVIENKVC